MARRPNNIQFGNADVPPLASATVLGLQHAAIVLVNLVYVIIITKTLGWDAESQLNAITTTLIGCGLGSILQARFGSRMLVLMHPNPIYIPMAITAGATYGAAGIAALVIAGGLFQLIVGSAIHKLRVLFPPEVCGVVVAMLGVSLLPNTLRGFLHETAAGQLPSLDYKSLSVAIITLAVTSLCSVWLKKEARYFSLLLGCLAGVLTLYFLQLGNAAPATMIFGGHMSESAIAWYLEHQKVVVDAPVFAFPSVMFPGVVLDSSLILIAAIAALVNVVDELGVLIGVERLDDADWRRPEFSRLSRGLQFSGLITAISGLFGGVALGMSSGNLSLAYATGVSSRIVGALAGIILITVAFFPFILNTVLKMPDPVLAGLLFYSAAYFMASGAELATSRMMSPRRALVIGVPIGLGVLLQSSPQLSALIAGSSLEHVFAPMAFATIVSILLNLLMRFKISQEQTFVSSREELAGTVANRMRQLGEIWGLHPVTVNRASAAAFELGELLASKAEGPITCMIRYNDLLLIATFTYQGDKILLPAASPSADAILASPEALHSMSAWLVKSFSDYAVISKEGQSNELRLAFEV